MTKTNMWFSNSSIKRKMLPKPFWPYIKKNHFPSSLSNELTAIYHIC